tara:strand:+ start:1413 stop:2042 length:630 start_codon:yes stop_codon:yes gene_type:complete
MLLVGITGSIGTGKSTTAKMFKKYNFGVYNADDTVHYIYENDMNVINKIEETFPGTKENNQVNRKLLRDILNKNPENFKELESIVHPVTRQYQINYIKKLIEEKKFGCVLDIPLLFETGGDRYVDASIVVIASEDKQRERVVGERQIPMEVFNILKKQQMPDQDKLKKANFIISTEKNIESTKVEVENTIAQLREIEPKAWNEFYGKKV